MLPLVCWLELSIAASVPSAPGFVTDPNSPALQALVRPLVVDEAKYGCGPLQQPGTTYYVSLHGDDSADGRSWQTAWRHISHGVSQLKPGDTLVIGEGEYYEPYLVISCSGEPGRPITIMAAPRHRVVLEGAMTAGPFQPAPGRRFTFETPFRPTPAQPQRRPLLTLWELDTQIPLGNAHAVDRVEEWPGTFCYDEAQGKLFVHFSDSRGPEAHGVKVMVGSLTGRHDTFGTYRPHVALMGRYLHIKGLHFAYYHAGVAIRGEEIRSPSDAAATQERLFRGGDHITVEGCTFFSTELAGLVLYQGARWCLVKGNYGVPNAYRGGILIHHLEASDNLILSNWMDTSASLARVPHSDFPYGINNYGVVGRRNHIIGNTMVGDRSFRSKYFFRQSVIQGNVMTGQFDTYSYPYGAEDRTEHDLVVVRNNTILGAVVTPGCPLGTGGAAGNWIGEKIAFVNNFGPGIETMEQVVERATWSNPAKEIAAARFADPAYHDYRLQADSPLIGKALGGGNIGAFRENAGRILYVSPKGNDGAPGTSERNALRTLRRAAALLQPGDTLYVIEGDYREPLDVLSSGTAERPIRVRAFGRRPVRLPGVTVRGSYVEMEGFTVANRAGDGILVRGHHVTLKRCVLCENVGAGILAQAARELQVQHCTLVGNRIGLVLERGSTGAAVRDSLFAGNRIAPVRCSEDSRDDYIASHNLYFGAGAESHPVATEPHSRVADPKFVNASERDWRLQWDSPAAYLALFGQPAGAMPVVPKLPAIAEIKAVNVRPDSAVIAWQSPMDDTTGRVTYRAKGEKTWTEASDPEQGTVHAVGLAGLKPGVVYEYRVRAKGRWGGTSESALHTFRTPTQAPLPAHYYLAPNGNDEADGRSWNTAWRTVRRANLQVGPGDTVHLAPGEYHHAVAPLTGGKSGQRITYRREGEGEAIIQGDGAMAPLVRLARTGHVTLEGLTLAGAPAEGGTLIVINQAPEVELLRCRVGYQKREGGFGHCILATACPKLRVEGNVVWGTRYHVTAYNCPHLLVKNNTFTFGQVYSCNIHGDHAGTKLIHNIFYCATSVPNPQIAIFCSSPKVEIESDYNLFWSNVARYQIAAVYFGGYLQALIPGATLAEWQEKSGQDRHSLQADPLFVDPQSGDFRLRPDSPAIGAGQGGANLGALGVAE